MSYAAGSTGYVEKTQARLDAIKKLVRDVASDTLECGEVLRYLKGACARPNRLVL